VDRSRPLPESRIRHAGPAQDHRPPSGLTVTRRFAIRRPASGASASPEPPHVDDGGAEGPPGVPRRMRRAVWELTRVEDRLPDANLGHGEAVPDRPRSSACSSSLSATALLVEVDANNAHRPRRIPRIARHVLATERPIPVVVLDDVADLLCLDPRPSSALLPEFGLNHAVSLVDTNWYPHPVWRTRAASTTSSARSRACSTRRAGSATTSSPAGAASRSCSKPIRQPDCALPIRAPFVVEECRASTPAASWGSQAAAAASAVTGRS
jgi:hypothetical protein